MPLEPFIAPQTTTRMNPKELNVIEAYRLFTEGKRIQFREPEGTDWQYVSSINNILRTIALPVLLTYQWRLAEDTHPWSWVLEQLKGGRPCVTSDGIRVMADAGGQIVALNGDCRPCLLTIADFTRTDWRLHMMEEKR